MIDSNGRDRGSARRVGAGILLARILGLVRVRVFAFYFGSGSEADAFNAALKIPNIIRNLVGEGTLSASFIPVYAAMLERDEQEAARQLSSTIASFIGVMAAGGALVGVLLAPVVTDVVAPGFDEHTRDMTVTLVRIMFPMAGVMILSGWCLGVLNTHRRFFLSYAAPTLWNIAQITSMVVFGSWIAGWRGADLVFALGWGALVGSVLQVLVQLPSSVALSGALRFSLNRRVEGAGRVFRAWGPVVFGAGVWQVSSLVDTQLGSLLGGGSVAFLGYAQLIAILPVSLFGVSIAAAALPELSRDAAMASPDATRIRLASAAQRVAFFLIPSAFLLAAHGSHVVSLLYQTGQFGAAQTAVVASILAAYSVGLPAQGSVRLLTSGHYALGDTRTPVRVAGITVAVAAALAIVFMQWLGVAGIALGSAIAAYVNMSLNYKYLVRKTGPILGQRERLSMWVVLLSSVLAAVAGAMVDRFAATGNLVVDAVAVLGAFGVVYYLSSRTLRHPDAMGGRRAG